MKNQGILKKLFLLILTASCLLCLFSQRADADTAAARFRVVLNDSSNNGVIEGTAPKAGGGCLINILEQNQNQRYEEVRYKIDDVVSVVVTVSGGGLVNPVQVFLVRSVSGYYTGVLSDLPAGLELLFLAEAKDSSGEVLYQGSAKVILAANQITDIIITLYSVHNDIYIPVVILSTNDIQIQAGETATINIAISDDNDEMLCSIYHSYPSGVLSYEGGLIALTDGAAALETVLTSDSSGGYSDTITVKVDDQHGGVAISEIVIQVQEAKGSGSATVNFAPSIDSLIVKNNNDGTMLITASVTDENTLNVAYAWSGDISIIGDNNVNPVTILEPFSRSLAVLKATDELGAESSINFYVSPGSADPSIRFTYVPPVGSYADLQGEVRNINYLDYRVAVYIKVDNVWWTKPVYANPLTVIRSDLKWSCDITTGGHDQDASHIMAFLLPNGYVPPTAGGISFIHQEVYDNAVAYVSAAREVVHRSISFSGYDWQVKTSTSKLGPGPNYFSDSNDNVWVDGNGYLHMKIAFRDNKWQCSEVICKNSFGYGKYVFYLAGRVDLLDDNVVLGLFTWDTDSAYNNREIDIEFSRWGTAGGLNSQYVVQPYYHSGNRYRFNSDLSSDANSVHFFDWKSGGIFFKSVIGSDPGAETVINSYNYTGADNPPPGNENPRINLWLMDGLAPVNGKETEVVIKKFEFIP